MSVCKGLVGAAVAVLLGTVVPAAGATLLINGSFETGVPLNTKGLTNRATYSVMAGRTGPDWDTWTSLNGWTMTSGRGIAVMTDRSTSKFDAKDGEYYVGLDVLSNTRMVQNVLLKQGTYSLSLWTNFEQGNASTNSLNFGMTGLGLTNASMTYVPLVANRHSWTQVSMNIHVATTGIYQVYVGGAGSSDGKGMLIDDIDLTQIPVPAAGFGLIAALASLVGLKRRRRA